MLKSNVDLDREDVEFYERTFNRILWNIEAILEYKNDWANVLLKADLLLESSGEIPSNWIEAVQDVLASTTMIEWKAQNLFNFFFSYMFFFCAQFFFDLQKMLILRTDSFDSDFDQIVIENGIIADTRQNTTDRDNDTSRENSPFEMPNVENQDQTKTFANKKEEVCFSK